MKKHFNKSFDGKMFITGFGVNCDFIKKMVDKSGLVKDISGSGANSVCKIVDDFAVLENMNVCLTKRFCENTEFENDFDMVINSVDRLHSIGVNTVPILGYMVNTISPSANNRNGYFHGFIVQEKAKGFNLFNGVHILKNVQFSDEYKNFLLDYYHKLAGIPLEHYVKFFNDFNTIQKSISIDYTKPDNFFYDENIGFQFVDMNFPAHKINCLDTEDYQKRQLISVKRAFLQFGFDGFFNNGEVLSKNETDRHFTDIAVLYDKITTAVDMSSFCVDKKTAAECLENRYFGALSGIFTQNGVFSGQQLLDQYLPKQTEDMDQSSTDAVRENNTVDLLVKLENDNSNILPDTPVGFEM